MAGPSWDEIPQEEWENIVLRVDDEAQWHVRFDYTDQYGTTIHYPEESITFDDFLDIYDVAGDLDQELEIEY
jgi:hypothetical protein